MDFATGFYVLFISIYDYICNYALLIKGDRVIRFINARIEHRLEFTLYAGEHSIVAVCHWSIDGRARRHVTHLSHLLPPRSDCFIWRKLQRGLRGLAATTRDTLSLCLDVRDTKNRKYVCALKYVFFSRPQMIDNSGRHYHLNVQINQF